MNSEQNRSDSLEPDKFREEEGREAAEKGKDSEFLNGAGLEDDLIEVEADTDSKDGSVISSDQPENQEWNAREDQNEGRPQ